MNQKSVTFGTVNCGTQNHFLTALNPRLITKRRHTIIPITLTTGTNMDMCTAIILAVRVNEGNRKQEKEAREESIMEIIGEARLESTIGAVILVLRKSPSSRMNKFWKIDSQLQP